MTSTGGPFVALGALKTPRHLNFIGLQLLYFPICANGFNCGHSAGTVAIDLRLELT